MFKNPFSLDGRIRRLEYGISYIIYFFYLVVVIALLMASGLVTDMQSSDEKLLYYLALSPGLWFIITQGAKRCHDRGNSGWWQLIPLYGLWMLFGDGQIGPNEYGDNPKGLVWDTDAVYNNGEEVKPIDDVDEDGVNT